MESKADDRQGCARWFRLLLFAAVSAIFMLLAGYDVLWVIQTAAPVHREICCSTPLDFGYSYEDVTISTNDGLELSGWYIPPENGAVIILVHGYGADRMEMLGRAVTLADHGYGTLLYDQRACGESEGGQRSFGWLDAADVSAVIEFLSSRYGVEPGSIGILGFSQGASIGLQAAAENSQVRAVVAEEPGFFVVEDVPEFKSLYERWVTFNYQLGLAGLRWKTGVSDPPSVIDALAEIPPRPILFIAGRAEGEVAYILVRHYYDLVEGPKEWWSVAEASHGAIPGIRPEEYETRITAFFDEWLLDGAQ